MDGMIRPRPNQDTRGPQLKGNRELSLQTGEGHCDVNKPLLQSNLSCQQSKTINQANRNRSPQRSHYSSYRDQQPQRKQVVHGWSPSKLTGRLAGRPALSDCYMDMDREQTRQLLDQMPPRGACLANLACDTAGLDQEARTVIDVVGIT